MYEEFEGLKLVGTCWYLYQDPRLQVLLEFAASHFGSHKPLALCLSSASPDSDQKVLAVAGIHVPQNFLI